MICLFAAINVVSNVYILAIPFLSIQITYCYMAKIRSCGRLLHIIFISVTPNIRMVPSGDVLIAPVLRISDLCTTESCWPRTGEWSKEGRVLKRNSIAYDSSSLSRRKSWIDQSVSSAFGALFDVAVGISPPVFSLSQFSPYRTKKDLYS